MLQINPVVGVRHLAFEKVLVDMAGWTALTLADAPTGAVSATLRIPACERT